MTVHKEHNSVVFSFPLAYLCFCHFCFSLSFIYLFFLSPGLVEVVETAALLMDSLHSPAEITMPTINLNHLGHPWLFMEAHNRQSPTATRGSSSLLPKFLGGKICNFVPASVYVSSCFALNKRQMDWKISTLGAFMHHRKHPCGGG